MQMPRFIAITLCLLRFHVVGDRPSHRRKASWYVARACLRRYRSRHLQTGPHVRRVRLLPRREDADCAWIWEVARWGDQLITRFKGKEVRRRIVNITGTELRLEDSPGKISTYNRTD